MAIRDTIVGAIAYLIVERPARKKTLAELSAKLAESGRSIEERAAKATDNVANRKQLAHIAGIERWGQRRLRVFLGEPYVQDEYDSYCPADDLELAQLREFFHTTRQETLGLVRQLTSAGVSDAASVPHNSMGKLSARAWLGYLEMHARIESKRLK